MPITGVRTAPKIMISKSTTKNAGHASRRRARHVGTGSVAATGDCRANANTFATAEVCPCRYSCRPRSGCHRKIRHRGGSGIRASAVAPAAERFLAVESVSQLPLPNEFGDRRDSTSASQTASVAVHCCAQQRHAARQCACVRLLPQACSPDAERSRLSLRYR